MATVTAHIRTTAKKAEKLKVYFRLTDGRSIQLFHKSEIEVNPNDWNSKLQAIKERAIIKTIGRNRINDGVRDRKKLIRDIYDADKTITSEQLDLKIDQSIHPEKYIVEETGKVVQTYFQAFDEFLEKHKLSDGRKNHFKVLKRALQRYELYRKTNLDYNTITSDTVWDIEIFLKDELSIFKKYPEIYIAIPESRTPQPRGQNTVSGMLVKFRTFCIWLVNRRKTANNPFTDFKIQQAIYGSPYYLTIEERNKLYKTDFSRKPKLAIQRDIFILQCMTGCRIDDFYKLTSRNIISGYLEYIARKTKEGRPITVRVPLNMTAKDIVKKYSKGEDDHLMPFISKTDYNSAIREMFTIAGIKRIVTVLNSTTREPETHPLNKIATSQLARRTFIGNIYKQVKDPNLVGSLSGHKEGSLAFARYREIDDEMKNDLVKLLE